jgi:hypothetical protein
MRTDTPHAIYRKDYSPPAWLVGTVKLHPAFHDGHAEVRGTLACRGSGCRRPLHAARLCGSHRPRREVEAAQQLQVRGA